MRDWYPTAVVNQPALFVRRLWYHMAIFPDPVVFVRSDSYPSAIFADPIVFERSDWYPIAWFCTHPIFALSDWYQIAMRFDAVVAARDWYPRAILFDIGVPAVAFAAWYPSAILSFPVVLFPRDWYPRAIFLCHEVIFLSDWYPTATLAKPVVRTLIASVHNAVFPLPVMVPVAVISIAFKPSATLLTPRKWSKGSVLDPVHTSKRLYGKVVPIPIFHHQVWVLSWELKPVLI